jgi:non-specific serine/threonine protein kinase
MEPDKAAEAVVPVLNRLLVETGDAIRKAKAHSNSGDQRPPQAASTSEAQETPAHGPRGQGAAGGTAPADRAGAGAALNVFRKDGEFWTLSYKGSGPCQMKDRKGFFYIRQLLRSPGQRAHVLDMVRQYEGHKPRAAGKAYGRPSDEELEDEGLSAGRGDGAKALPDEGARRDYRRRLAELNATIDGAVGDPAVLAEAEEESKELRSELRRAAGLGRNARPTGTESERARVSVTRAVWAAIDAVPKGSDGLRQHLLNCIKTGVRCVYEPDEPTAWVT